MSIDWPGLIRMIKANRCTPFLGAGAAYPTLPLGKCLALELIKRYEADDPSNKKCPLPDKGDLAKVAQWVSVEGDSLSAKLMLAELIAKRNSPDFNDLSEPHRLLAELPFRLYMTSNYDDFMVGALRHVQNLPNPPRSIVNVHQDYCRWSEVLMQQSSLFDGGFDLSRENPVVFHLHGHIVRGAQGAPPSIDAMVATEDDYLDFLVNVSSELANNKEMVKVGVPKMLPPPIRNALLANTLLFIGYSLEDVNFRVILRTIRRSLQNSNQSLNITVQYAGDKPQELQDYLEKYFDRLLKLQVGWITPRDFATELRKRWTP